MEVPDALVTLHEKEYGCVPPLTCASQSQVSNFRTGLGPVMLTLSPGFTYTFLLPVTEPAVACTSAVPTATPVTTPVELMESKVGVLVPHVGVVLTRLWFSS